jgi:hypothetical protein
MVETEQPWNHLGRIPNNRSWLVLVHSTIFHEEQADHRDAVADEIGCERRQPIELILRITILDRHVLADNIAVHPLFIGGTAPGPGPAPRRSWAARLDGFSVPDRRDRH